MSTSKVTIQYLLSEAGRRASLERGGDGHRVQSLEVEGTIGSLALARIDHEGRATINVGAVPGAPGRWVQGYRLGQYGTAAERCLVVEQPCEWDQPQEPEPLLALLADLAARLVRERAAVLAQAEAAIAAEEVTRAEQNLVLVEQYRLRELRSATDRAEAAAERQAEASERAAYAVKREDWVREHGSERLRAALALGLLAECNVVYCDERLAVERPGWEWEPELAERKEVRNPTLPQLQALAEARRLYPAEPAGTEVEAEVELVYIYSPCRHGDHRGGDERECSETLHYRALRAIYLGGSICRRV